MKKKFSIVMILVLVFSFISCGFTFGKEEPEWFLGYIPGECKIRGNTLYVNGLFTNYEKSYDIVELGDIQVIVTDSEGNLISIVQVNDEFEKKYTISHYGCVAYNFTVDLSESAINSIYQLRYNVEGEYSYAECEGENCTYCGGVITGSTPSPSPTPSDDEKDYVKCTNCKGTGICSECDGTGKNDCTSVVLRAMGCTLCDKSGKCHKCNGAGVVELY